MDGFTIFILIWAGWCVYGVYLLFKGKIVLNVKGATEKKDPRTSEEKYRDVQEQIRIRGQWQIGKSAEECRREVRRWDGHWR